jgi:lincosamide nucleotidyltransferase A/C/D/E
MRRSTPYGGRDRGGGGRRPNSSALGIDAEEDRLVDVTEVLKVLDELALVGARSWVAGGWGVDALAGSQTREHRDLDLAVDADDLDACMGALAALGYHVETDSLPLRVEVAAPGRRWVDVHPVAFDVEGHGLQGERDGVHFDYPPEAWTRGRIGERTVPCLSVTQQRRFHSGYEHRAQDEHDLLLLDTLGNARQLGE